MIWLILFSNWACGMCEMREFGEEFVKLDRLLSCTTRITTGITSGITTGITTGITKYN